MQSPFPALAVAACALLLAGCGTLPQARPFADATRSLAVSVSTAGTAVTDSLADAGTVTPSDRAAYARVATDFREAWKYRIRTAQAAAGYSEAVADLIAAGQEGRESVDRVAGALTGLAAAAGVPLAGASVGVASDVARFVAERVALVRASAKLEEAVARADPVVQRLAELINDESEGHLRRLLRDAHDNVASGIKSAYDADANFAPQLIALRQTARSDALRDAARLQQLQEYDRAYVAVAASLRERDRRLDEAAAAHKARLQLLSALSAATMAWAQAHTDLAAAMREKRRVSTVELQETVLELRGLARKVRAL